jgi:hypothetical protein
MFVLFLRLGCLFVCIQNVLALLECRPTLIEMMHGQIVAIVFSFASGARTGILNEGKRKSSKRNQSREIMTEIFIPNLTRGNYARETPLAFQDSS